LEETRWQTFEFRPSKASTVVGETVIRDVAASLRGQLLAPGDAGYDAARDFDPETQAFGLATAGGTNSTPESAASRWEVAWAGSPANMVWRARTCCRRTSSPRTAVSSRSA
jgi:hypothetical protein